MRVAFQGELSAFSGQAARLLYPGCTVVPVPSMEEVFEAVEGGAVDRGVVPIENSLFGSVHINYDLLRSHRTQIAGEISLRIRHCLMAVAGAELSAIRRVLSHPQALGQCREYLRAELPDAESVPAYDTAGAAKLVAEQARVDQAAIAPRRAADVYGLHLLATNIESHASNYTRFLSLAADGVELDRRSAVGRKLKTSVVFAPRENVPGALFKSLAVFFLRELDLFKVESRPLIGHPGRYLFYLDVEGGAESEVLKRALAHLNEVSADVRVLGSYPHGPAWEDGPADA